MHLKLLLLTISSTLGISLSSITSSTEKFKYQYEVRANSFLPLDEATLYYVKEKLINKYEELCLSVDEQYHHHIIESNINLFKFADDVTAYYQKGVICLVIGKGKGSKITGALRKNYCDTEVIREKIYIFDILNGL